MSNLVAYQLERHLVCGICIDEEEQSSKMSRYIKSKERMAPCTRGILRHERKCVTRDAGITASLSRSPEIENPQAKIRRR